MLLRSAVRVAALLCLFAATTAPAFAQCELEWLPGPGHHGTSGNGYDEHVFAMHRWDPDGAGPQPTRLVFGGSFPTIGPLRSPYSASWDPATGEWASLGTGTSSKVYAFATAANGDLLVGGSFFGAGGVIVNNIARWNGTTWSALGEGVNSRVIDIAVLPNGDVVAVGYFTTAGGGAANRVARWNGSTWSPLGSGSATEPLTVVALPNGDVVVGGSFTSIGGVAANGVARWDGAAWHALGSGLSHTSNTAYAFDMTVMPTGDLAVAGYFTHAGGIATGGIAGWDGSSWYAFGAGIPSGASSVHVEANGDLLVNAPAAPGAPNCSRWDGTSWQPATTSTVGVGQLTTLPGGDIVLAGQFTVTDPNGTTLHDLARWNGTAWVELHRASTPWFSPSLGALLRGVAVTPDGTLYVAGLFQIVDGQPHNGIARFNGSGWDQVGGPLGIGSWPFPYPYPLSLIATKNGDIVVCGRITGIAGGPAGHIARWNGTSWQNLNGGVGANGSVNKVVELPNGDLVVSGDFTVANGGPANYIARYDGAVWHPLGVGADGYIRDLLRMPNGDVVAVGDFRTAAGSSARYMARWDGSSWSSLGNAPDSPLIEVLPDGNIVAVIPAVPFTPDWSLQRWNGTSWSQMGPTFDTNQVSDLVVLPNGDVIVSAYWGTGMCLRLHGSTWTALPTTDYSWTSHAWTPDGELILGGDFRSAGQWLSPYLARLRSNCAAAATVTGAGCAGSGGNNTLAAKCLPWLGSTFLAAGTELPTLALVSQVWGFSPLNLPLAALLPEALPGCDLLVTPDFVQFSLTTDGTVATSLQIPSSVSLVGAQVHHQLNLFEVDAGFELLEVTASNALALTLGAF